MDPNSERAPCGVLPSLDDLRATVSFTSDADWNLLDHVAMDEELSGIFGRKLDLLSRRATERSSNWIRRKAILESAEPYFVA